MRRACFQPFWLSCLKTILNRAVRHEKLDHNPIDSVKKLAENNVRMRILDKNEFEKLVESCAEHLKPIVMMAYYTGMRRAEIVRLTWAEVDMEKAFIRLKENRTKTKTARAIPLHPRISEMLRRLPRGLRTDRVFLKDGKPFDEIKKAYKGACTRAKIDDLTFHDLRHCALNNLRLAGNDFFKIMAISGHKTISVFKRYNLVTEDELSQVKWGDEDENQGSMDTNMDTKEKGVTT